MRNKSGRLLALVMLPRLLLGEQMLLDLIEFSLEVYLAALREDPEDLLDLSAIIYDDRAEYRITLFTRALDNFSKGYSLEPVEVKTLNSYTDEKSLATWVRAYMLRQIDSELI